MPSGGLPGPSSIVEKSLVWFVQIGNLSVLSLPDLFIPNSFILVRKDHLCSLVSSFIPIRKALSIALSGKHAGKR